MLLAMNMSEILVISLWIIFYGINVIFIDGNLNIFPQYNLILQESIITLI